MVKNSEEMGVYGGNPAKLLRHHNALYDDFLVGTLHGTDLKHYISAKNYNLKNNDNSLYHYNISIVY